MPFEQAQVDAMLAVADGFNPRGKFGSGSRDRVRAMILLLRYSGLRISDASMLERRRLSGDKLFLYIQKTGTPSLGAATAPSRRSATRLQSNSC